MSIKRITDLPYLMEEQYNISNLHESVMEVSFKRSEGDFVSRGWRYGEILENIKWEILSGGGAERTEFHTIVDFFKKVNMYAGLNLSGDFLLNQEMEESEYDKFRFYVNTGSMNIKSAGEIDIKTNDNFSLYSDGDNTFCASQNILCSDINSVVDNDGENIVLMNKDKFTVYPDAQFNKNVLVKENINCNGDIRADGNVYGVKFYGVAMSALWADIAEYYRPDTIYKNGTLVMFGGKDEITIASGNANGVVTTNPGYVLNSGIKNGIGIALTGRVPVRIIGKIKKFDKVVLSDIPGIGRKRRWYDIFKRTIGISLEENNVQSEKNVECVVQLKM